MLLQTIRRNERAKPHVAPLVELLHVLYTTAGLELQTTVTVPTKDANTTAAEVLNTASSLERV